MWSPAKVTAPPVVAALDWAQARLPLPSAPRQWEWAARLSRHNQ